MNKKWIFIPYILVVVSLFFYSFTQIDLNLTLSQWSVWQVVEKFLQHIGYFNRPLSTIFYLTIIVLLFAFYILMLYLAHKKRISKKEVWYIIGITSVILAFSYNAFSYDLFNYMFDAKIITYYHQNPYEHKALDYMQDPMLNFMHWTHRTYPYGPVWLAVTVPLSYLGFQFFLPTFFLFKFLAAVSFFGTVYFVSQIVKKIAPSEEIFSIIFLGLNPLVIIESLVSAHNDIAMMFFAVFGFFLLLEKKYILAFVALFLSIGIKFATIFLTPIFIAVFIFQIRKKNISWDTICIIMVILLSCAIILATLRTNFQPWYLLYIFPFAALIAKKYFVFIPAVIITFFSLLQYAPFLYLGNWDNPVPSILSFLTQASLAISLLFVIVCLLKPDFIQKRLYMLQ